MTAIFHALVVWLVTVLSGLAAVAFVRFLATPDLKRHAPVLGFVVTTGVVLGSLLSRILDGQWIEIVGAAMGFATLWWQLFGKREFSRG